MSSWLRARARPLCCPGPRLGQKRLDWWVMNEDDLEDYEREAELSLFREYRDIAQQFRYVVETERRFYLANEVDLQRRDAGSDFYFELSMHDVWVWDVYRSDRFVKSVRVLTFKDVNVEELSAREFKLPQELSIDDH